MKSPVSTILPLGVFINIPRESGIEWTVLKKPILKCSVWIDESSFISMTLVSANLLLSWSFFSINAFANLGA